MKYFKRKFEVKPNQIGFMYLKNKFEQKLEPGIYKYFDFKLERELYCIPTTSRSITITNQEILSKDYIAFRLSLVISYRITDGRKFLDNFELNKAITFLIPEAEQKLAKAAQIYIRDKISQLNSDEINEKRAEFTYIKSEMLDKEALDLGLIVDSAYILDMTFPKNIQDLFAKLLEAKIRTKVDLENARTSVAAARALKNASELMKDDENIKFIQILETLSKITAKGSHTLVLGDFMEYLKKK